MNKGYIKLYRKFRDWEWYDDINCKVLFLELLLTVNFENKKWQGNEIRVGEIITSYEKMAIKTNLSIQQVRTALKKMKESEVVKITTTSKFTKISVVNFETYQSNGKAKEPVKKELVGKTTSQGMDILYDQKPKEVNTNLIYFENIKVNDIFKEFLEHRKLSKVPNTEQAVTLLVNELNNHSDETKIKMLETSIMNNWKSVFPPKNNEFSKKESALSDIKLEDIKYLNGDDIF